MFGRKNDDVEEHKVDKETDQPQAPDGQAAGLSPPSATVRERTPAPPLAATMPLARPEPVRHPLDIHAGGRRLDSAAESHDDDGKSLTVGPGIELTGQIRSCDKLSIEGVVESDLCQCSEIEIAERGAFKGEAQVETADVAGRFEGSLTAQKLLIVRATGRITGRVRFGQIEIMRGGEIDGNIQVHMAGEAREALPIHASRTSTS